MEEDKWKFALTNTTNVTCVRERDGRKAVMSGGPFAVEPEPRVVAQPEEWVIDELFVGRESVSVVAGQAFQWKRTQFKFFGGKMGLKYFRQLRISGLFSAHNGDKIPFWSFRLDARNCFRYGQPPGIVDVLARLSSF